MSKRASASSDHLVELRLLRHSVERIERLLQAPAGGAVRDAAADRFYLALAATFRDDAFSMRRVIEHAASGELRTMALVAAVGALGVDLVDRDRAALQLGNLCKAFTREPESRAGLRLVAVRRLSPNKSALQYRIERAAGAAGVQPPTAHHAWCRI